MLQDPWPDVKLQFVTLLGESDDLGTTFQRDILLFTARFPEYCVGEHGGRLTLYLIFKILLAQRGNAAHRVYATAHRKSRRDIVAVRQERPESAEQVADVPERDLARGLVGLRHAEERQNVDGLRVVDVRHAAVHLVARGEQRVVDAERARTVIGGRGAVAHAHGAAQRERMLVDLDLDGGRPLAVREPEPLVVRVVLPQRAYSVRGSVAADPLVCGGHVPGQRGAAVAAHPGHQPAAHETEIAVFRHAYPQVDGGPQRVHPQSIGKRVRGRADPGRVENHVEHPGLPSTGGRGGRECCRTHDDRQQTREADAVVHA